MKRYDFIVKLKFAILISTAFLLGCNTVHVDGPLGTAIEPEAMHRFVGQWEYVTEGDGPVGSRKHVRMLKDGRLRVAELKWSQADQKFFVFDSVAVVTRIGQYKFLNLAIPGSEEAGSPVFLIARLHWTGDSNVELFPPDFNAFEKLLQSDDLRGQLTADGQSRTISLVANDVTALLENRPNETKVLFPEVDGKAPIVLNRVQQAEDAQKRFSRSLLNKK